MSFYVIEGPNGSGKTTLINKFKEDGIQTLSSPSSTKLSKKIRPMCRGEGEWHYLDKTIKFLLFSAARLDEFINIVKNNDELVIADRWWTSTYIYQCLLEGIPVKFLEQTIHSEEKIDGVFLLHASPEVLFQRMRLEREKNKEHGECSWVKENETFLKIVELYYSELSSYLKQKGIDVYFIDVENQDSDEVMQQIKAIIESQEI
jgi:dTMP kinase